MDDIRDDRILVVLAAAPGRLSEASRFLGRRGWTLRLRSDLKSFMADIVALKPKYALMSVDFVHENISKMRGLIEGIYHVKVIDFSEESGVEGWARLKAVPGANKIFGVLTGPAIERALVRLSIEVEQTHRASAERALREGSGKTLGQALRSGDGTIQRPLTLTSRLTCIQVRASALNGHFLVAMGSDKILDDAMIEALKTALSEFFVKAGLAMSLTDSFVLDVRRVEFKKWAAAAASFLERGVHDGAEVAMAFFPAAEDLFVIEASPTGEMGVIDLNEIAPEVKIDFEVYLHLPLNGKFVLYVSKGGWMSLQQQLNLQSRGIHKLHIQRKDSALLFRARAHRSLDRMIADFYESRAAGQAA